MGIMDQLVGATDAQKKAALDALASSGKAGLDAYNAGIQATGDATARAAQTAAQRGAWMGGQASNELAGIASSTGDAARQALERAKAQYAADNQNRQGITGAYFDEMKAGVPLISAWTDSQAKLKGQEYEQQLAREKEQQDWAREQHAMQMEMLRAQMARSAAGGSGGSAGPTTAQQKALAQSAASEQQRAAEQQAMKARLDEMNAKAMQAMTAASARPNEHPGDWGMMADPDSFALADQQILDARKQLMPDVNWDSGSLDDMAAAYDKIAKQTGKYATNSAFTPAKKGSNELIDVPLSGYSAFAQEAAPQRINSAASDAQLRAIQRLLELSKSSAADEANYRGQYNALRDDTNNHLSAYQAALDQGSDPWVAQLAAGNFDPAQSVLDSYLKQQQTNAQNDYFNQTGYKSPSAALSAQNAQRKLGNANYDQADVALANKLMTSPDQLEAKRNTEAYQQATNIVGQLIAGAQQGGQLPTADVVRQELMATGDPNILAVIPLVLAEMDQQGVLFSQGFSNQAANG